jgi:predicted MFS family arabinose efflux permease
MPTAPLRAFVAAACGVHLADQLALAALPLLAVLVLDASPATVGALVAAHGAAWLLLTLPGGVWVDRAGPSATMRRAQAIGCAGLAAAVGATLARSVGGLAAAAFVASAGTVLFVLSVVPAIRAAVPEAARAAANARLELARAAVTLAAPLAAGALAQRGATIAALVLALIAAVAALAVVRRLPPSDATAAPREAFGTAIRAGAGAVLADPLLRAIAACAVLFNLAFFALVAIWAPHALGVLGLDAAGVGLSQAGCGVGLLAGAAAAPRLMAALPPRVLLVGGPACAALAAVLLAAMPGAAAAFAAQLMVGFGPMVWQVQRTTLTQQRVPAALLGRASATIQLAVYGVRPIGALAGGAIAQGWGTDAAIVAIAAGFAASAAVMGIGRLDRARGTTIAA